jgi:hypothetical protein
MGLREAIYLHLVAFAQTWKSKEPLKTIKSIGCRISMHHVSVKVRKQSLKALLAKMEKR